VFHRLLLKNQVLFLPPFFEGGRGGFAFYHDMGNKKSTSALAERDALVAEIEKLKALLASKQS
jgi:hypothetical protein